MYLTRMELNPEKRGTILALSSPSMFHGAIESAFAGERQHPLWRIDSLNGKQYLMILSREKPTDMMIPVKQFGVFGDEQWVTKDYTPLLERIENGTKWYFRLTANPVINSKTGKKDENDRGKVYAHITPVHQKNWLMQRAEKHGFFLKESEFDVVNEKWYRFNKNGRTKITLLSVTYEGILEVRDRMLFSELLCSGIGRGKAYGMGLLTVVRYHG